MQVKENLYTLEEFEQIALLPENADKRLEYIGGEIVDVVSNNYSSQIAAFILIVLGQFVLEKHLGRVTTTDGGYTVGRDRYIPDVAFISFQSQPKASHEAYNPLPPDLAVEVLSPSDDMAITRIKIGNYLAAGVVVWLVDPERKKVEVYRPGQPTQVLGLDATLDGSELLPGFSLEVSRIFDPFGEAEE